MNTKKGKRLGGIILIMLVLGLFILPISYETRKASEAEAFTHGDYPTWGLYLKEYVLDGIASLLINLTIEKLARDTVNWINSGFDGNPAYVQNPKSFLTGVGDDVAGEYILSSDFGFVCSPFKLQLKQSLLRAYIPERRLQCTLSDVVNNVENFVGGDFYDGGWDAWGELVTRSNPYTQFLGKQNELSLEIEGRKNIELQKLQWGAGFLSYETCPGEVFQCKYNGEWRPGVSEAECALPQIIGIGPSGVPLFGLGGAWLCVAGLQVNTPGSVIEEQLNKVIGLGGDQLVAADEINEIVTALVTQLINKVLGPGGGLGDIDSTTIATAEASEQCVDGIDNDGDGKIDSADPGCQFGSRNNESADSIDDTGFIDFCREFGINPEDCIEPPDNGGGGSCVFFASNGGDYCDEDENDSQGILINGAIVRLQVNTGTGGTWFITPWKDMRDSPPPGGWPGDGHARCQAYGNFGNTPPFPITMEFSDSDDGQTFDLPASTNGSYTLGVYGGSGAGNEAMLCTSGGSGGGGGGGNGGSPQSYSEFNASSFISTITNVSAVRNSLNFRTKLKMQRGGSYWWDSAGFHVRWEGVPAWVPASLSSPPFGQLHIVAYVPSKGGWYDWNIEDLTRNGENVGTNSADPGSAGSEGKSPSGSFQLQNGAWFGLYIAGYPGATDVRSDILPVQYNPGGGGGDDGGGGL